MAISRVLVRYEEVPQELKYLVRDEGYEEIYEGDEKHLCQEFSLPELINLTPHAINVIGVGEIPSSGLVARVSMKTEPDAVFAGFPTSYTDYGEVENLPEIEGVSFVVSKMVRDACPDRADLFYPAELVRDETGNIIGCKSLGI